MGLQGTGVVLTLVNRKSRLLSAAKFPDRKSERITAGIITQMCSLPCHTITLDNGKEFAGHKIITEEPGVPVYFAHPHSPWERGTNENTNKLLREFLPKGKSFEKVTQKELDRYVSLLNNRPKKCLGYKTPREVFEESFKCIAFGLTN